MATTETATFAVELKDETSGAAEHAASSLENLKKKIAEGKKALAEMQAAQRAMKGASGAAAEASKALADKIAAQKASLAAAHAQYVQLGGAFGAGAPKAQGLAGALGELLGQARGLPGPLGAVAGRLTGIGGIAGAVSLAIGAVVGAMVALLAVTARATASLLRYGIAQSDARRSELLRLEGLTTLRHWYGLAAGNATEMQAAIDRVSDATALGRGELEQYTTRLYRMGLRGEQLSQALEGVAIAASVQGDRGASRFMALAVATARTGGEVRRLTEDYQARLGPIARRQMLALDVQTRRLHQNLERLFSGLRLEAFLSGLHGVLSLFSQTTVTGRALKRVIESLFQPLVDFLGGPGALMARRFFQGMVLGALLVERQILRLRIWLRDTFGESSVFAGLDTEMLVFKAGAALVLAFAGAVVIAAAGLVALGAAVAAILSPILTLGAAAVAAGTAIVDGLVAGVRGGVARVTSTVQDLATRVRSTFADALQIRSPSRVFAELGRQIPAGVTLGIEGGSPEASGAAEQLVQPPAQGARRSAGAAITIAELHIHAPSSDPEDLAETFVDRVSELLEGAAITMGAPA